MREPLDHFWICWVKLGLPGQMGHPLYLTYLRYLHTYVCTYLDGVTGYVHIRFPRRDAWWVTGGHFIPFYFEACTYIPRYIDTWMSPLMQVVDIGSIRLFTYNVYLYLEVTSLPVYVYLPRYIVHSGGVRIHRCRKYSNVYYVRVCLYKYIYYMDLILKVVMENSQSLGTW